MLLTSALGILALCGHVGNSVLAQTLNDPDGLINLRNLAQEIERSVPDNKSIPIVFGRYS